MKALLIGIVVLHVTALIFLFISTIDNSWRQNDGVGLDLWKSCVKPLSKWTCGDTKYPDVLNRWIQAVQAFMILSIIFCIISLVVFLAQLFFFLEHGAMFHITGAFQLLACVCVVVAASMYTAKFPPFAGLKWGYSFILAWCAFPLTLITGILYFIMKKK
uniref:peripheral myelin protein 22-like n=1 Tax=Myxine glutinosa TaxID=7769 RepID=UPI00358FD464